MGSPFSHIWKKLRLALALSTLWAGLANAHEVTPTIGEFTVEASEIRLTLRMNVEAFLAGIDLDGLEDTNETDQSDRYDALRAMPADELEPLLDAFTARWLEELQLSTGQGTEVPLIAREADIPPVGNVELPRASVLAFSGTLPDGAQALRLAWPDGDGALVLRQMGVEAPYTGYLQGGETSPAIPLSGGAETTGWESFITYIPVGFDHILPKGLDHILFVLGLFFLSARLRPLVWQVSAFTLAHTVTLALGALGVVTVNASVVEPLIAASIAFVALENVFSSRLHAWRPVIVFGFGLLHGLGFASVLEEFGLPEGQFVPALIGFNIGVELGQLTVIALAFLAVGYWFRDKPWYRARIAIPASLAIAAVGLYWTVERVGLI
ncbi:HupE/UreJ family protein [Lutimaribacter marinistellae]|uniref:HupE/UreJ family protein n=1 Tax=Lutimaribacter marinistellae TaxID=1820329 RepID=A0ABV7TQA7_9RHOB